MDTYRLNVKIALTDRHLDVVTGYVDGVYRVARELGVDLDALDDALLTAGIEKCKTCGLYGESSAMTGDDGEPDGHCDNCRRYGSARTE